MEGKGWQVSGLGMDVGGSAIATVVGTKQGREVGRARLDRLTEVGPYKVVRIAGAGGSDIVCAYPTGVGLASELGGTVDGCSFFFVVRRVMVVIRSMCGGKLGMGDIHFGVSSMCVGRVAGRVCFVCFPVMKKRRDTSVIKFVRGVVCAVAPIVGRSAGCVSEFVCCIEDFRNFGNGTVRGCVSHRRHTIIGILGGGTIAVRRAVRRRVVRRRAVRRRAVRRRVVRRMVRNDVSKAAILSSSNVSMRRVRRVRPIGCRFTDLAERMANRGVRLNGPSFILKGGPRGSSCTMTSGAGVDEIRTIVAAQGKHCCMVSRGSAGNAFVGKEVVGTKRRARVLPKSYLVLTGRRFVFGR